MKALGLPLAVSLLLASSAAAACGTHPPAVQAGIDAQELAALERHARAAAQAAEEIYIGTVTGLVRPAWGSQATGAVRFSVERTLKGEPASERSAQWQDRFIHSCRSSDMFHNVGFRPEGTFIVYVRDGTVLRSDAADHLRSGLLTLERELAIVAGARGN